MNRKAAFGYVGRAVSRLYPLLRKSIKGNAIKINNVSPRPLRIAIAVVQVSELLGPDLKGFIHRKMLSKNYRLSSGHWLQFVECLECSDMKFSELDGGDLLVERGGSSFPVSQEAVQKYDLDYYLTVNVSYNGSVLICQMSVYDAQTNLLLGSKSDRWFIGNLRTFPFQSSVYFLPYFSKGGDSPAVSGLKLGGGLYLGSRVYRSVEIGMDFVGVFAPDTGKASVPESADADVDVVDTGVDPSKNIFQWASGHFSLGFPFWEYTSLPVGIIYPVLGYFWGRGTKMLTRIIINYSFLMVDFFGLILENVST